MSGNLLVIDLQQVFPLLVKSLLLVQIFNVTFNESQSVSHLANFQDLLIRCLWITIENVLLNAGIEQNWLLHDIADLLAESFHIIISDVDSINHDLASLNVVELQQQVGNCAFSTARVTDQSDLLGRWNQHVKLIENFSLSCWIAERDLLELNLATLDFFDLR